LRQRFGSLIRRNNSERKQKIGKVTTVKTIAQTGVVPFKMLAELHLGQSFWPTAGLAGKSGGG
jgi:hypothetical protein